MSQRRADRRGDAHGVIAIDSTLPPTSPEDLFAAGATSVLVFSHDAALAGVIKRVAEGRYPLRVIGDWPDLIRLIKADVGRIVLLDVDALNRPVEKALLELNQSAEWLVVVIAAKQQDAQDFMRFWSERRIHRLLIKPAAVGITRLLLESAVARYIELREQYDVTDSLEIPPGLREYAAAEVRPRRGRSMLAVTMIAAAVAAGAYLLGFWPFTADEEIAVPSAALPGAPLTGIADADVDPLPRAADASRRDVPAEAPGGADGVPATVALPAEPVPTIDPFRDLIAAASRAAAAGRLASPPGDNALDRYLEILEDDPEHAAARAGLDAVLEQLFMRAEAQFLERDLASAEQTLAHIGRASPASTRLRFLTEQLAQARATAAALAAAEAAAAAAAEAASAAAAEAAAVVEARPEPAVAAPAVAPAPADAELVSMLTLVERRIEQRQLVAPDGDSARDYLGRAIGLGADDPRVIDIGEALYAALVAEAQPAFAAGDLDRAAALVAAALELGPTTAGLEDLDAAIAAARREQAQQRLETLAARIELAIEQGELIDGDESALALLGELRVLDASYPLSVGLEGELGAALAAAARAAMTAAAWPRAEALVGALAEAALDDPTAAVLRRELDIVRRQAVYLAEPAQIGELELLRAVPPEYPRDALARDTTGWVELQFTVDREGQTRDLVVIEADPPGTFDAAAIDAVARYRFAPFELDGTAYERRARVRVRFVLD